MLAPVLSRQLASAINVLTLRDELDHGTRWKLMGVINGTDAKRLTDYPRWVVELVEKAEAAVTVKAAIGESPG